MLVPAFIAAERYGVARLRAAALRQLCRTVSAENAAQLALLSAEHRSAELWAACVRTAASSLPEVVATDDFQALWAGQRSIAQRLTTDAAAAMSREGRRGRRGEEDVAEPPTPAAAKAPKGAAEALMGARAVMDAAGISVSRLFGSQAAPEGAAAVWARARRETGNVARAVR
jgi:hypothetical protein